jgi:transcriptional regulator with XRE-family HTH domain
MYEVTSIPPEDVRRVRRLLGDTQVQFAKRLGVEPVTVARWETGQRRCAGPYAEAVVRLDPTRRRDSKGLPQGDSATLSAVAQLVRTLFRGSTALAMSALLEHEKLSDGELDALAQLIDAKKKKKKERR